jgi:hypothetical protein
VSKTNVTYVAIIVNDAFNFAMIKNQRSYVSKNSNSLNGMIKKTSMTFTNNNFKKIASIATAILMLSAAGTLGFSANEDAFAKKPDGTGGTNDVVSWSNGFPSGPHWNLNIHGKKLGTDPENKCDNSPSAGPFGASVFVPQNTSEAREWAENNGKNPDYIDKIGDINFVSNKRSDVENLTVLDPCGAPFGNVTGGGDVDEVLVQYPKDAEAQVYMRILGQGVGNPHQDVSVATYPVLRDACDFLPAFEDGSVVQSFDIDCVNCSNDDSDVTDNTVLTNFADGSEMYENSTMPDAGFSVSETVYKDVDSSANVTATGGSEDIRLANAITQGVFVDGNAVIIGDSDETTGLPLFNFTSDVMYNDADTSTFFTVGETIYKDTDANGYVSAGDVRLANAITQGVSTDVGGDILECNDSSLIGLGLTTGQDAYVLGNETNPLTLERLNVEGSTIDGKGQGNKKGKSLGMDVTGMFQWTGAICDTQIDYNLDGAISIEDFDIEIDDGDNIIEFNGTDSDGIFNATDLDRLLSAGLLPTTNSTAELLAVADVDGDGEIEINNSGGTVEGEGVDEFLLFIGALDDDVCRAYDQEWIFNIADIVIHGLEYENNGSNLVQLRFYPTDTTNFEE